MAGRQISQLSVRCLLCAPFMQACKLFAALFRKQIASSSSNMRSSGATLPTGLPSSRAQLASSSTSRLLASRQLLTGSSAPAAATCRQTLCNFGNSRAGCLHAVFSSQDSQLPRGVSTTSHAAASVALEREEAAEEQSVQYLDLEGETDEDGNSLEEEFEEEKGRRSLASIFESDEEDVLQVDANLQDETLLVENIGLSDVTINALHGRNVKALFPIQKHVFDPAMEGRDLVARAKTGSGKTLAFSLPVIESLLKEHEQYRGSPPRGRTPRCIVLAPTRELAKQVEREFQECAPRLALGCFYGGVDIGGQIRDLRKGMDVVVGTPGRVMDLMDRRVLDLSNIKFFILDEADMMLNQGFEEDVERIMEGVPEERQTMLFSATVPGWVKRLSDKHLKAPIWIDLVGNANAGKLNEDIKALAVQVERDMRRSVLVDVLTVHGAAAGKSIIFVQTKRDADEVAAGVAQTMPCEALHGDMSQKERERKLDNFRKGKFNVLVATDVAARGLDIPNVELVLHYELPRDTESFLHRSGRTARAGKTGTTIALFTRMETGMLRRIIKEVGAKNLEIMAPPSPKAVMAASAKGVLRRLDNVDPQVKAFFEPAAKLVMAESDPEDALCRALAALSGLLEVPKPRSLLSQQIGYVTLRVLSRPGRVTKQGHVMTIVRNILGEDACGDVGRIRILPAATCADGLEGAAFDLPEELALKFMEQEQELSSRDFRLDQPKSLPLEEERFDRSGRGGSYGGRGGYGSRSGGRGGSYGGGSRSGGYSRGNDRGRSSYGNKGSYGGGGGGGGRGGQGSRGNYGSSW